MKSFLKFLAGLTAIIGVGVLSINLDRLPGSAASARDALRMEVAAALKAADAGWARVTLDGQKVAIAGEAPSEEALGDLKNRLLGAAGGGGVMFGGVTVVDASGASVLQGPPPTAPYIWAATRLGDELRLTGFAPSQSARDAIFQLAAMRFPASTITGELDLASGSPPEEAWLAAVSASLQALAQLESGAVTANGADFAINGVAGDELSAAAVRDYMERIGGGVTGTSQVRIKATAASPEAEIELAEVSPESAGEDAPAEAGPESAADAADEPQAPAEPMIDDCRPRLETALAGVDIAFDSARAALDNAAEEDLRALAAVLLICPQYGLTITGHTDASGDSRRNQRLSLDRADAVAALLRDAGVAAGRLETSGVGAAEPVAGNDTEAGRAQNRRIEFELKPTEPE